MQVSCIIVHVVADIITSTTCRHELFVKHTFYAVFLRIVTTYSVSNLQDSHGPVNFPYKKATPDVVGCISHRLKQPVTSYIYYSYKKIIIIGQVYSQSIPAPLCYILFLYVIRLPVSLRAVVCGHHQRSDPASGCSE